METPNWFVNIMSNYRFLLYLSIIFITYLIEYLIFHPINIISTVIHDYHIFGIGFYFLIYFITDLSFFVIFKQFSWYTFFISLVFYFLNVVIFVITFEQSDIFGYFMMPFLITLSLIYGLTILYLIFGLVFLYIVDIRFYYQSEFYNGESEYCNICYDEYKRMDVIKILPCKHFYHNKCILEWFSKTKNCPLCRSAPYINI